jgi:DNA-binding transcriptional MocR family regulator
MSAPRGSAIAEGRLAPAERLPAVRHLAAELEVSPAAAAYRTLNQRGLVSANRCGGTAVAAQRPLRVRAGRPLPPNTRDLANGNPDPAFLARLEPALARLDSEHKLYGGPTNLAQLEIVHTTTATYAA